jgi:septum site-determining protein MinD
MGVGISVGICSGKGGVGKTTISINLGAVLAAMGKEVILIDGDVSAADVSLQLKLPAALKTINDAMCCKEPFENILYSHASGLKVIPASFSLRALKGFDRNKFSHVVETAKDRSKVTIVDCAPGLGPDVYNSLAVVENAIVVTNPEIAAVADAHKCVDIAKEFGVDVVGIILNRVNRFRYELDFEEVKEVFGNIPVVGVVPEDPLIGVSQVYGEPIISKFPAAKSARAIAQIGSGLVGEKYSHKYSLGDRLRSVMANPPWGRW